MTKIEIKTINFFKFENSEQAKKITNEQLESIFLYFLYWQMNKEKINKVTDELIDINEIKKELFNRLTTMSDPIKRATSGEYKTFFNSKEQFNELKDFFDPDKSEKSIKQSIEYTPDDDDPLYITFKISNPPTLLLNFIIYANSRKESFGPFTRENINNNYDIYYGDDLKKILGFSSTDPAPSSSASAATNDATASAATNDATASSNSTIFEEIINSKEYKIKSIKQDGHCFYRAVITAINPDASQEADDTKVSWFRTVIATKIKTKLEEIVRDPEKVKDNTFFQAWASGDKKNNIPVRYEDGMSNIKVRENITTYIDNIKAKGKSSRNVSNEFWADEFIIGNTSDIIEKSIVIIDNRYPYLPPIIHYGGTGEYIILYYMGGCHYDIIIKPSSDGSSSSGSFNKNTLPISIKNFIDKDSKKSQKTGGNQIGGIDTATIELAEVEKKKMDEIERQLKREETAGIETVKIDNGNNQKQIMKNLFPFYISYENIFNTIPHQIITSNLDEKIKKYNKLNTIQFLPIINNYNVSDETVDKKFIKEKYKNSNDFYNIVINSINIYTGIDSQSDNFKSQEGDTQKGDTQKGDTQEGGYTEPVVSPNNLKLNKKLYINYYKYILIKLYHNYRDEIDEIDEIDNNLFENMCNIIISVDDINNLLKHQDNILKLLETDSFELVQNICNYYYSLLNHFYTFNLPVLLFYTIEQKNSNNQSYIYKSNKDQSSLGANENYQNYEINQNKVDEIDNILRQILYYIQPIIVFNLLSNGREFSITENSKQVERKNLAAVVNANLSTSTDEPIANQEGGQIGGYGDLVENFIYGDQSQDNYQNKVGGGGYGFFDGLFTSADADADADVDADANAPAPAPAPADADAATSTVTGTLKRGIETITKTVIGDSNSDTSEKIVKLTYYSASNSYEDNLNDPKKFLAFFHNYKKEQWRPLQNDKDNLFKRNILKVEIDPEIDPNGEKLKLEDFIQIINFIKKFNRLPSLTIIINCNVIYSIEEINTYYKGKKKNEKYSSFKSLVTQLLYSGPPKNISFYKLLEEFKNDYLKEGYLKRFIFNKVNDNIIEFNLDDKEYNDLLKKYKLILEHTKDISERRKLSLLNKSMVPIQQAVDGSDAIEMVDKFGKTSNISRNSTNRPFNISPLFLIKRNSLLFDSMPNDYYKKLKINKENSSKLKDDDDYKNIFELNKTMMTKIYNHPQPRAAVAVANEGYLEVANEGYLEAQPHFAATAARRERQQLAAAATRRERVKAAQVEAVRSRERAQIRERPQVREDILEPAVRDRLTKKANEAHAEYMAVKKAKQAKQAEEAEEAQVAASEAQLAASEAQVAASEAQKAEEMTDILPEKVMEMAEVAKKAEATAAKKAQAAAKGAVAVAKGAAEKTKAVAAAKAAAKEAVAVAAWAKVLSSKVSREAQEGRKEAQAAAKKAQAAAEEAKNKAEAAEEAKNKAEAAKEAKNKAEAAKNKAVNAKNKAVNAKKRGAKVVWKDMIQVFKNIETMGVLFQPEVVGAEKKKTAKTNMKKVNDILENPNSNVDEVEKVNRLLILILAWFYNSPERSWSNILPQHSWSNILPQQKGGSINKKSEINDIQNKYQKTKKNLQENRKHKQTNKKQKKKKNMNIILKKKQKIYSKSRRNYKNIVKHKSSLHNIS